MRRGIISIAVTLFLIVLPTAPTAYAKADEPMEFIAHTYAPLDRSRTAETMVSIKLDVKMSSVTCDKPYTISLKWNAVPYGNPALMGKRSVSELVFKPVFLGYGDNEFAREFERKTGRTEINLGTPGELQLSFMPPPNAGFSNDDLRFLIVNTHSMVIEGSFRIPFCVEK